MPNTTSTPARILIAADSPLEALALENQLCAAGHPNVRVTSDGREIERLHEKWPFVLLVLDMGIRSQSSLDVLEQLREHIARRQLAVLALTDVGDEVAQERALNLGAVGVFTRPFTRSEIFLRVTGALASLPEWRGDAGGGNAFSPIQ